jgi:hypothetical protein
MGYIYNSIVNGIYKPIYILAGGFNHLAK